MKRKGDWFEWIVPKEWKDLPLQEVLLAKIGASKALIHQWRMGHDIKVNEHPPNWTARLKVNDRLLIHLFEKEPYGVIPEYRELEIVYEDDHVLVVNKPDQMATHPNESNQRGTLANALAFYYQMNGKPLKVRHVHRLDQNTSGAVVFAKHKLAHIILDQQLEHRELKRTYLAVVHGHITMKKGSIETPIGRDRHHPTRRRVSPQGKYAKTNYQLIDYVKKIDCSIMKAELDTGRTHQIRVHFSSIGHPLVGDILYGGKQKLLKRQALHAETVRFIHPITKQKITVKAPLLADMKPLVNISL